MRLPATKNAAYTRTAADDGPTPLGNRIKARCPEPGPREDDLDEDSAGDRVADHQADADEQEQGSSS